MRCLAICISLIILFGCAEGPFDPSLVNPSFQGITVTDETGTILGPVDTFDWKLYEGPTPYPVSYSELRNRARVPSIAAKILPTDFAIYAAYPNPSNDVFVMQIDVPVACLISIWVINTHYETVWKSVGNGTFAGAWAFEIVLSDDRQFTPDGIYRLVYEIQAGEDIFHGHGDLKLVHSGR